MKRLFWILLLITIASVSVQILAEQPETSNNNNNGTDKFSWKQFALASFHKATSQEAANKTRPPQCTIYDQAISIFTNETTGTSTREKESWGITVGGLKIKDDNPCFLQPPGEYELVFSKDPQTRGQPLPPFQTLPDAIFHPGCNSGTCDVSQGQGQPRTCKPCGALTLEETAKPGACAEFLTTDECDGGVVCGVPGLLIWAVCVILAFRLLLDAEEDTYNFWNSIGQN